MATFQHPASLNAFQQFTQAGSILRNTTRASNPAWYQDATELDLQLHIRADGAHITAFYHDRRKSTWSNGPSLAEDALHDPAKLESLAADALRYARASGAKALGIILHIADEFATTELKPELDNPSALSELRDSAISDPGSILEDSSILADQSSWRVIPYPAAGSVVIGTTVTLSRLYTPFITALRDVGQAGNFPIITKTVSAPMVALMGIDQTILPTPGKPFVVILQYPWFTGLAFFNEHADLRLIRTLQHRGLRRPTNFRNSLATTNASLEFIDPDLFLIALGSNVDTTLDADLKISFSNSRVEIARPLQIPGLPDWCPEPAIAAHFAETISPTIKSHTFTIFREEKWALQDFLPTPKELADIYPDKSEMRMLKFARISRGALFGIAVICVVYFGYGMVDLIRRPEWAFSPDQASIAKQTLATMTKELQKAQYWGNLMEDRSRAWTAMESFSRMFPENGGMLVKTYSHTAQPDTTKGKTTVGFLREWKITGYARDEALAYLNNINTREGVNAHFNEIARITGNNSFLTNVGTRSIVINVRTQENSSYKPVPLDEMSNSDDSTYPFTFDMTITQRFEATDPLAIIVTNAP